MFQGGANPKKILPFGQNFKPPPGQNPEYAPEQSIGRGKEGRHDIKRAGMT